MYKVDYHTHTSLGSPDAISTIDEICMAAISAGISELCITDHNEVNGWNGELYNFMDEQYLSAIEDAKKSYDGRLIVLAGMEIGQATQNSERAAKAACNHRLDFVIGSLHNIAGVPDFYFLEYPDLQTCRDLMDKYFSELRQLILLGGFDVLGHLSYPLRYIRGRAGLDFDFTDYTDVIVEIYKLLISAGKGIEVNMSGLRQPLNQTMPAPNFIKLYRDCGGEIITLGSDAHAAVDIGAGIGQGQEILKEAGFRYQTVYRKRNPDFVIL